MKTNIIHLNKVLKRGDKFVVCRNNKCVKFMVMAAEIMPKGMTNTYWVLPVLEGQ